MLTDDDYIYYDAFPGDEAELTCRTVTLRKARKEHDCFFCIIKDKHKTIKPGDRYREEKALVDGDFFGRYCICFKCIEDDYTQNEEDDQDD